MNIKPLVLCVDDEVIVLNSLLNQLRNYFNHEIIVEGAESGNEALEVIDEFIEEYGQVPQVIISDQIMPNMRGDELLAIVHEKYPDMMKILLTGQAEKEDIVKVINKAQLFRYIEKPWEILDLGLSVKEAIKLAQRTEKIKEQRLQLLELNKHLEEKVNERTKALNAKNEELLAGIRYAKNIQDSILPDFKKIVKNFADGFIFFRPLGILSGDFFWYMQQEGTIFLAAVDCTGHGVPGAMMSIIGNNLLNEIILIQNETDTGEILKKLNFGLHKILNQSESGLEDGMDIALCKIVLGENRLEFSGAKNPLFYIKDGKLEVLKGGRFSVGGLTDVTKKWDTQKLDLDKISHIYLSSDGYQDQFGGPENKKFSPQRLRDLLSTFSDKNMTEQHQLLEKSFEEWKGGGIQIDDVMVMGISF